MNLLVGIPVVALVIVAVLFITGAFDQDPIVPPIDIPTVPDNTPTVSDDTQTIPTIPTEPTCTDSLYVTVYRYDLRTGEYDWYMFEGDMKCHNIDAYKESPDFIVEYENGFRGSEIRIQTIFDANTNGWQEGYNA